VTDSVGRYRVADLPAGTYTLHVRRLGFAPDSFVVAIRADSIVTHDVTFHQAAVRIAELHVIGNRVQGSRQATIDEIRVAPTIVNIIGSQEIKALPNANAADAAARLPGVTTERAEGEGEFIQVRGTESRLANVTIDGVHVPGTVQGGRNPRLDDIPADLISEIQVSKTLTANMDADAVGGTVNIVTQVPEGSPHGSIRAEYGAITLLDKRAGEATATFGGRVARDRFGFFVSGSYDVNQRVINDIEPTWAPGNSDGSFFPNEFSLQ